jgi:hypothetical protein
MKSLTVCLPDLVFERATSEALRKGVELAGFCSGILADHVLTHFLASAPIGLPQSKAPTYLVHTADIAVPPLDSASQFNVLEHFKGYPIGSIRFAQVFVDEALKFPGVKAFRASRGIGFKPNFVFIEYLMSRGGKAGIGVSFYGEPQRHKNPPRVLSKGIPSYSRAKIYSEEDLNAVLPHIRQSFELKFGKI